MKWPYGHFIEIRKLQAVPVVMITGEAEQARAVTAIQAGVSHDLVKPFTLDALKEKLEKWVGITI